MPLSDTAPAVKKRQMQIERAMSGEQRVLWALEASLLVREFTKAGIRSRHPDWTEVKVAREMLRLQFLPAKLPPVCHEFRGGLSKNCRASRSP